MGVTELLTLIFVTLKLTGQIDWNWFWVVSPLVFVYGLAIVVSVVLAACGVKLSSKLRR